MRRRQRRLRWWWRHEQRSVAAALAAATHHSAPRSGWPEQHNAPRGPTTASAMEVEAHEQYYAPRGQEQPPLGVRPAPLPEVAGPQAAVTFGYVAAVAPSLAVVRELDLLHDDATAQFLLQQSLLARAQEEEEARELEEVKRMEGAVVTKMQRLEAEVMKYAGRDRSQLSDLEYAAVTLVARSDALRRRRRERRKKRKKQRKKKLPRAPRPRCRRPCVHQRQVPAVRIPVMMQRQVPTVHSFLLPVQFLGTVFDMPVVVLRQVHGFMVQKTVDRPQLQSIHGCRHSLSFRCGSPSWSRLFSRPQRFPSCCSMVDVPVMWACRVSGAAVEKTFALPQLQLGLFPRFLVFGSHLFGVRPWSTPYSALLGSPVDT